MATKKVQKGTIQQRVDNLQTKVKNLHDEALQFSDNMVETSLKTGADWQKIMAKAMNGGTVLLGKQQDFVLSTLEDLKGQYVSGNKRFRKLLGRDTTKAKKAKKATTIDKILENSSKAVKKVATPKVKTTVVAEDLKVIDGIGPKMETLLNKAGITTFNQLATTDAKKLSTILETAGPRFKTLNTATWKEQAKLAAAGKLTK